MGTAVLVHGAWHGAWCWDRVVEGLASRGHTARAIDLPGHGASTLPLTDLAGDTAHVRQGLDAIEGPVVLVGHSYGGAVITGAGDHPAVSHLLYVTAFALDAHESCSRTATDEAASIDHSGRPDLAAALVIAGDGTATIQPEMARTLFYNRCGDEEAAAATAQLGPQTTASLTQRPAAVAWRTRPSTYAVCTDDNAVHPELQMILAARTGRTVEWDADHSPFLSAPELVVDLVAELLDAG
jgi:pimeloyl-ACP methyl ester carboxylesterase